MEDTLSYMDLIKEFMQDHDISSDDILFKRIELSDMTEYELKYGLVERPEFEKPKITPVVKKVDLNELPIETREREWYKDDLKPKDAWVIGLNINF